MYRSSLVFCILPHIAAITNTQPAESLSVLRKPQVGAEAAVLAEGSVRLDVTSAPKGTSLAESTLEQEDMVAYAAIEGAGLAELLVDKTGDSSAQGSQASAATIYKNPQAGHSEEIVLVLAGTELSADELEQIKQHTFNDLNAQALHHLDVTTPQALKGELAGIPAGKVRELILRGEGTQHSLKLSETITLTATRGSIRAFFALLGVLDVGHRSKLAPECSIILAGSNTGGTDFSQMGEYPNLQAAVEAVLNELTSPGSKTSVSALRGEFATRATPDAKSQAADLVSTHLQSLQEQMLNGALTSSVRMNALFALTPFIGSNDDVRVAFLALLSDPDESMRKFAQEALEQEALERATRERTTAAGGGDP